MRVEHSQSFSLSLPGTVLKKQYANTIILNVFLNQLFLCSLPKVRASSAGYNPVIFDSGRTTMILEVSYAKWVFSSSN